MGAKREKCPKCGTEMELRAGVVLVCPMCEHTERLKNRERQNSPLV